MPLSMSGTSTSNKNDERAQYADNCVREALVAGGKAAGVALLASGAAVFAAHTFWPAFRRGLGVSGRTALVVSPAFGMYFLQAELTMNECARKKKWQGAELSH